MNSLVKTIITFTCVLQLAACNYVTYTPRSKGNIRKETPSIILLERIVDFRTVHNSWPVSREDFISKGVKYYEVMHNFPYAATTFKVIDSNTMTFSFSNHIKDQENYNTTGKVDLNAYSGSVKFFKQDGRFVWKLKMN